MGPKVGGMLLVVLPHMSPQKNCSLVYRLIFFFFFFLSFFFLLLLLFFFFFNLIKGICFYLPPTYIQCRVHTAGGLQVHH